MKHEKNYIDTARAYSLIISVSDGCSYGECSFCSAGELRIRSLEDILEDLAMARENYDNIDKVFIVDGDSLSIDTDKMIKILKAIGILFGEVEEINVYANAISILEKDIEELSRLREAGLTNIYMGLESGSDELLKKVSKGVNSEEIFLAARKINHVGLGLFARVIVGLAGLNYSMDHARDTAKLLNRIEPNKIVLEGLPIDESLPIYEDPEMRLLTPRESLREIREMIELMDFSKEVIIESRMSLDGVSISGELTRDKDEILELLDREIDDIGYQESSIRRI